MKKKDKYSVVQIEDGKWYRVRGYTHSECCDCALVHKEEIRLVDGHLEWRAYRDDETTNKRRKELGIKVNRVGKDK
jgi:transcription initiation factor TFIIIB Brf1 subunit/transcription initiation factor TFIIB